MASNDIILIWARQPIFGETTGIGKHNWNLLRQKNFGMQPAVFPVKTTDKHDLNFFLSKENKASN